MRVSDFTPEIHVTSNAEHTSYVIIKKRICKTEIADSPNPYSSILCDPKCCSEMKPSDVGW